MPEELAFSRRTREGGEMFFEIVIRILVYAVVVGVLSFAAVWLNDWLQRRPDFEKSFGFSPKLLGTKGLSLSQCQSIVDQKLRHLAGEMVSCFQHQEELQRTVATGPQNAIELAKALRLANRLAEQRKKEFWTAHGMAKKEGFTLGDKYTYYLPLPGGPAA